MPKVWKRERGRREILPVLRKSAEHSRTAAKTSCAGFFGIPGSAAEKGCRVEQARGGALAETAGEKDRKAGALPGACAGSHCVCLIQIPRFPREKAG